MPYALFKKDLELCRGFDTHEAAFRYAGDAGLTEKGSTKPTLIDGYTILEVEDGPPADSETASDWSLPSRVN